MLDNGGLMPLATGKQVRLAGGNLGVIDGPFAEAKEVVGGYAIFELPGMEEAVAMATEFMQLHKEQMPGWEGVCEIRTFASPGRDASVWRMRSMTTAITDAHRAVVAVWRIEQPRL